MVPEFTRGSCLKRILGREQTPAKERCKIEPIKALFLLGGRLAALAFRKPTAMAFIYRGRILRNRLRIEQSFGSLPKQNAALVAPPKIISHGAGFCQVEFFVHFAQKNNPNLYLTHKQKPWYN